MEFSTSAASPKLDVFATAAGKFLRALVAVGQHVYGKALSLVHEQRNEFGVGAIVSYMQIDASKMGDALPYLHLLWSGPVTLIIATVGPFRFLGVARRGESSGEMSRDVPRV